MNDSEEFAKVFEEYVEDYDPEEKEKIDREKQALEQEAKKAEEAAKRAQEEQEAAQRREWAKAAEDRQKKAFKTIETASEKIFKKRTDLIDFLTVQAHFDRYSVKNCLLVAAQFPGATRLRPYNDWEEDGRHIKKGAKSITVIEPGDEFTRNDGTVGRQYTARSLFDISQVTGKIEVKEEQETLLDKLKLLFRTAHAYDLKLCSYGEDGGRAAFFQKASNAVYVNKSVELEILYPQLCVELSHAVTANGHKNYSRQKYGSVCEMSGYILCVRNNVSVPEIALPLRIPEAYAKLSGKKALTILEEVRSTANNVSRVLQKMKKTETKEQ